MKKQAGFTLIELAIVLVIIGLLLGGVLRGQELINSAKVKNMVRDFQNVQVYVYGYQDRFKTLPGDDHHANTHLTGGTNATAAGQTQNGVIEGNWNTGNDGDETCVIWQHVRLAGLAPGSTANPSCAANNTYQPRNADGGLIGIQSLSTFGGVISGMTGAYVVCSNAVLGRFARQVDATLDDGVGDTGVVRVQGIAAAGNPGVASPDDGTPYMVCMSF
jgi:prepilin-type N-terminal cleavage/methylation domain-containing protein